LLPPSPRTCTDRRPQRTPAPATNGAPAAPGCRPSRAPCLPPRPCVCRAFWLCFRVVCVAQCCQRFLGGGGRLKGGWGWEGKGAEQQQRGRRGQPTLGVMCYGCVVGCCSSCVCQPPFAAPLLAAAAEWCLSARSRERGDWRCEFSACHRRHYGKRTWNGGHAAHMFVLSAERGLCVKLHWRQSNSQSAVSAPARTAAIRIPTLDGEAGMECDAQWWPPSRPSDARPVRASERFLMQTQCSLLRAAGLLESSLTCEIVATSLTNSLTTTAPSSLRSSAADSLPAPAPVHLLLNRPPASARARDKQHASCRCQ
jgi:hypothetical protein